METPTWLEAFIDQISAHIEVGGAGEFDVHYEVPAPDEDPVALGIAPEINYRHFLTLAPARLDLRSELADLEPPAAPVEYIDVARIMAAFETTLEAGVDLAEAGAGVVTVGGYLMDGDMKEPVLLEIHVQPLTDSELAEILSGT